MSDPDRVERWAGLRQDSGDPFAFAPRAISLYWAAGVDPQYKQIIFSDALDIE